MSNRESDPLGGRNELRSNPDQVEKRSEYICQGPEVTTKAWEAVIESYPTIEVVKKVAKDVWVLRMTKSDKKALKSQFGGVIFELNQELRLW